MISVIHRFSLSLFPSCGKLTRSQSICILFATFRIDSESTGAGDIGYPGEKVAPERKGRMILSTILQRKRKGAYAEELFSDNREFTDEFTISDRY